MRGDPADGNVTVVRHCDHRENWDSRRGMGAASAGACTLLKIPNMKEAEAVTQRRPNLNDHSGGWCTGSGSARAQV